MVSKHSKKLHPINFWKEVYTDPIPFFLFCMLNVSVVTKIMSAVHENNVFVIPVSTFMLTAIKKKYLFTVYLSLLLPSFLSLHFQSCFMPFKLNIGLNSCEWQAENQRGNKKGNKNQDWQSYRVKREKKKRMNQINFKSRIPRECEAFDYAVTAENT